MNGKKARENQELYVVKSNDLIRARYNLTVQQQKILAFAIMKIKPNDKPGTWFKFSISELCNACGIKIEESGTYYKTIKEDVHKLTTRYWAVTAQAEFTYAFFNDVKILKNNGEIQVQFHPMIEEHLILLTEKYTQYKLKEILPFKNKYTIRIYELLLSYIQIDKIKYGEENKSFLISELKNVLQIENKYEVWYEFERNVIKKAEDEINKYSEIMRVKHEIYKSGKQVYKIDFIISSPNYKEKYVSEVLTRDKLNGFNKRLKTDEVKQRIKSWRESNQSGTRTQCINETGLTRYAVNRYWNDCGYELIIKKQDINENDENDLYKKINAMVGGGLDKEQFIKIIKKYKTK